MAAVLERMGELIWGPWTAAGIMAAGVWLSFRTGWPQLPQRWWRSTAGSLLRSRRKSGGISPFQSVTAALAGSLGTGNIVGVAVALSAGGPGAVLWMWAAAFFGMATAYAENVLGIRYRQKNSAGQWLGGPMPYLCLGLGRGAAVVWAVICAGAALCLGNLVQVNSVAEAAARAWQIPPPVTGVVLAAAAAPAVLGGAKSVTRLTERLVPVMAAVYILACLGVIIINIDALPLALRRIFREAFCPRSVGGGILGAMLTGVRRGVFTNEAGMGTSVLIHCTADDVTAEEQGRWSIFEIFADTMVMCSLTALAVLTSGADRTHTGAAMTTAAFSQLMGGFSRSFAAACTLLFAFATVVGWSCCGERAFAWLLGEEKTVWYRLVYVLLIIPGCVMNTHAVWAASDILNALLMLPNLAAVVILWNRSSQTGERRRSVLRPKICNNRR